MRQFRRETVAATEVEQYDAFNAKLKHLRLLIIGSACWFLLVIIIPDAVFRILHLRLATFGAVRIGLSAALLLVITSYLMYQIASLTKVIRPVLLGVGLIVLSQIFRVLGTLEVFKANLDPVERLVIYALFYTFVNGLGMLLFAAGMFYAIVELLRARNEADKKNASLSELLARHQATEAQLHNVIAAVEQSQEGIAITDRSGIFQYLNPAFAALHGYTVADLLGAPITKLSCSQHEVFLQNKAQPIEGSASSEVLHQRQDGSHFYARMNSVVLRDEHGQATGAVCVLRDISEQKRSEAVLERRDAILEAVAAAAEGLLHVDSWETTLPSMLARLAASADVCRCYLFEFAKDPLEQPVAELRGEFSLPSPFMEPLPVGSPVSLKEQGRMVWFEALGRNEVIQGNVQTLPNLQQGAFLKGDIISLLLVPVFVEEQLWGCIGYDDCQKMRFWEEVEVEALRTAALILAAAIKRDKDADLIEEQEASIMHSARLSSLGTMAAGVAHEINNPLTNISIAVEQFQAASEKGDQVSVENYTALINRNIDRIVRIVRTLRNLSRKDQHEVIVKRSVRLVLEDSLELCKERLRKAGIQLQTPAFEQADIEAEFSPTQLAQVIMNLLSNACDAVEEAESKWIEIDIAEGGAAFEVHITDSGPGVPDEIREKIFDPFHTTKVVGKGTGLGLSIARRIIDEHGGDLYLDTDHPNTRFVVRLPKEQVGDASEECSPSLPQV